MTIRIDIFYRTKASESPVHLRLDPEAYFAPLEPGETYARDAIPRFDFTWQYLDAAREELVWSIERRAGTHDDYTFSTQYFDDGRAWINHRSDPSGYEELIHAIDLGDFGYLTVRTFKQPGGRWVAHMVSLCDNGDRPLYSLPDGAFEFARKLSTELAAIAGRDRA
jgi:hypothetical protein